MASEIFLTFNNFCLQVGERIRVILDCDDNTLSFEKNYEFLGVAFRGMTFYLIFLHFLYIIHYHYQCLKFETIMSFSSSILYNIS